LGELTALHQNLYLYLRGLLLRGVREKGRGEEGEGKGRRESRERKGANQAPIFCPRTAPDSSACQ